MHFYKMALWLGAMAMAFFLESLMPLGDLRWLAIAIVCFAAAFVLHRIETDWVFRMRLKWEWEQWWPVLLITVIVPGGIWGSIVFIVFLLSLASSLPK